MSYKKKILIFGIAGQDGSYLTKLLLKKKFKVYGVVQKRKKLNNFKILGIKGVKIFRADTNDFHQVKSIISSNIFIEIYYLSGVSSVSYSNTHSLKTIENNCRGIFNILESCKQLNRKPKIYNAASSECFGNAKKLINEKTPFNPLSPYALSKVINYYITEHYKKNFKFSVYTGFSFNHDSPLRPNSYALKKIINFAKNRNNQNKILQLGNIDISRDWGWAPEHVKFIYKILRLKKPHDFIIGTGKTMKLRKLINMIFEEYNLSTKKNLKINKNFIRKNDIIKNCADPKKLRKFFNDYPKTEVKNILNNLIHDKLY